MQLQDANIPVLPYIPHRRVSLTQHRGAGRVWATKKNGAEEAAYLVQGFCSESKLLLDISGKKPKCRGPCSQPRATQAQSSAACLALDRWLDPLALDPVAHPGSFLLDDEDDDDDPEDAFPRGAGVFFSAAAALVLVRGTGAARPFFLRGATSSSSESNASPSSASSSSSKSASSSSPSSSLPAVLLFFEVGARVRLELVTAAAGGGMVFFFAPAFLLEEAALSSSSTSNTSSSWSSRTPTSSSLPDSMVLRPPRFEF
mmetsp:Transcript_79262/g.155044  ORF Transcript_79262/g.155044 Transcript_79262/m.155044 type:complete len:258 (+) Transcript_79262:181-954(+)